MMGIVVKLVLGLVLFAGSLVGALAATGRLNHEGTANIPVLGGFFPPPPPEKGKEGEAGKEGEHAADPHGAPVDAHASPAGENQPADASHDTAADQDPNKPKKPNEKKVGKSVVEPEKEEKGGGHGGGHGDAPEEGHGAEDAHGKADDHGKTDDHAKPDAHGATDEHGKPDGKGGRSPDGDFKTLDNSLHNAGSQYKPGDLFRFSGMPAGVTPEQINEMWQKVQGLLADIERRKIALDQREAEVKELHEETGRRQAALATERVQLEQMQREIDAKIDKFREQVKLVRNDEVAALKRNAQTMANFEPQKAAELVEAYWKSDGGQDQVLRTFEFMDKDAVNEIIKLLPNAMIQDVMKKRMRVSKESATPGK
ncbi:MAG: hypothetical protein JNK15_15570 [Planctomycetes bacterium]|nr:hypothetical protein [Planctomycetota bacterium]